MVLLLRENLKRYLPTATFDLLMVLVAWLGAYWLRFNLDTIPEHFFRYAIESAPIVVVVQGSVLYWFGVFRGIWRFASLPDLIRASHCRLSLHLSQCV